jgi:hypothetical protein
VRVNLQAAHDAEKRLALGGADGAAEPAEDVAHTEDRNATNKLHLHALTCQFGMGRAALEGAVSSVWRVVK